MFECNFCKNELSSLSNFNKHQKTNKKCLGIQQKISNNANSSKSFCEFCKKHVFKIDRHFLSCKMKKQKDSEKLQSDFEKLQSELEKVQMYNEKFQLEAEKFKLSHENLQIMNAKQKKEILEMTEYIIKLETENNIFKKDHETITSIAKQPKINTNTNNNTYNLSVYDDNIIKDRFLLALNNAKPSDLYDDQKSIGRFVADISLPEIYSYIKIAMVT